MSPEAGARAPRIRCRTRANRTRSEPLRRCREPRLQILRLGSEATRVLLPQPPNLHIDDENHKQDAAIRIRLESNRGDEEGESSPDRAGAVRCSREVIRGFGYCEKVVEVLDEMPEPDVYVFACLLDALCKNGCVKDAANLFEDMRLQFFSTDRRYFALSLYGWCREGKIMEAKHVLVQMNEAGFEPDVVDYTNLLSGYAHAGKMDDAYDVLKDMRR
ncbi:Pentatricopeptide repeat protein [Raphanus sativus]|nr:Pentatricopeptide repeat protein [Raphanus sativus]